MGRPPTMLGGMNRIALNTELALTATGEAPAWVELIPAADSDGFVAGRDGRRWRWDGEALAIVLASYQGAGIDLPIDWEHATQHRATEGGEAPAAGWITAMEGRSGALWGQVAWTPRGMTQVANREYRFLSPVFDYSTDTRRIARLVCAGLTNTPNLRLVALNRQESLMKRSENLTHAITGVLGLTPDAADDAIAEAINTLRRERDTARAENSQQPSLERFVPRADYDAALNRAEAAEAAIRQQAAATHDAAVKAALDEAIAAGKITPATRNYYQEACNTPEGLSRFREFVGAAPVIAGPSSLDSKPTPIGQALNAQQIADQARAYQSKQRQQGNEISIAAAVRHIEQEANA